MKTLLITLSLAILSLNQVLAKMETQKCPASFTLDITSVRAYQNSVNSKIKGWKEARDVLEKQIYKNARVEFVITPRAYKACDYIMKEGDVEFAHARLTEKRSWDYEDGQYYNWNRLQITFSIGETELMVFIPLKSYDGKMEQHEGDETAKILTPLIPKNHTPDNRSYLYDVGVIGFDIF